MSEVPSSLADAYAICAAMAREHYENFPVASFLLPPPMRPHIAAIYAFARTADDMADEGNEPPRERQARLSAWQQRLHEACARSEIESLGRSTARDDRIVAAAAHTIRAKGLPVALFDDLVSAFAQDITTTRYETWDEVMDYCRRSANPVGRLVLLVAGDRRGDVAQSSDALCTALQLTNFWQDFGRDWQQGRLYVPRDVLRAAGASERDLEAGRWTAEWTRAIERCVTRTRELFARGRGVCDAVPGRLRIELRATWLGGRLVLDRVAARADRVLFERPRIQRADAARLVLQLLRWRPEAA